ncbi:MAG: thermopsin [Thermoplasmata archaeon]|nr:thermopsin [Thermoplasmata archaeon]
MKLGLRSLGIVVVAVAAVMLLPAFSTGFAGATTQVVPTAVAPSTDGAVHIAPSASAALVAHALAVAKSEGIPSTDLFLPNVHGAASISGGVVQPLYTSAPAPMGLGYFGTHVIHGANFGMVSYYPSIEGAVTLNSVDPYYLASSSPDIFTMQLNTVLTHVTVLGNTSGQFWIQNVPLYFAASHTLAIEDNIWNFSAPGAAMQVNTLHSYDGNLIPGVFYYAVGPAWNMPMPFTVHLYNNATVLNNRPTVFFNYSITTSNGSVIAGSYDKVEFNSAVHPTHPAANPVFQVDGKQYNAFGLLNDAEIMLGGPGGGSTTTLLSINATMGLWTLANHSSTYVAVPSAYSFGTDTGETSEGIAEWTPGVTNPIAVLGSGPSLLQPLWGVVGAVAGSIKETFTLTPSNAFVFANQGPTWNLNTAAWAPVPPSGVATYELSPHSYSFDFLLSDYKPVRISVSSPTTATVTLAADAKLGVYTPLWAWDSGQLAAISQPGGLGTVAHPYVLDSNSVGMLSPLFGEFNDFYYPVFPGISIANSNAYVTAANLPDFAVAYTLPAEALSSAHFGSPYTNNLGLQFYNDTHISLVSNPQLTGWAFNGNAYISSVLFWNTSDSLIAGNGFQVQSIGAMLSGGTNNVVWGNVFTAATTTAANPATIQYGTSQNGLQEFESGDRIYNNEFLTPVPAVTPPFNLYTGAPTLWLDRWNVTPQPASVVHIVNGWHLAGNILGMAVQSGNYWANYGTAQNPYGVLPYTDSGGIFLGGDADPLVLVTLHRIVFTESGLPPTTPWSVTINGFLQTSASNVITFWEPSGALYAYAVGPVSGFTATPSTGAAWVHGGPTNVGITWT